MNKKTVLKILKYLVSLAFSIGIIYFLFKNQDPIRLVEEIQKVDGKWVVFSMIFGALAYISRGLRWIILIDAIGYQSTKLNSIAAVSVGYFTNIFVPRAGEISRCTAINQVEKIPIDKLFGTILIERVIDFIFLFGLLLFTIVLKFKDIINFYATLQLQQTNSNNYLLIGLVSLIIGSICLYFLGRCLKKSKFYIAVTSFINGLIEGFKSITQIKHKAVFWAHTFSIWIMYFLMTYICFFCMTETLHLTAGDGLFLLVLGGIGMVIPTPGGLGSYHAIVMIGLSVLGVGTVYLGAGGDPTNPALIFPTIVHIAQTLVAMIMGSLSLLILFLSKKKSNATS